MPQVRKRKVANNITYSSNNKVSEKISRGAILRDLTLKMTMAPTVSGANNTAAKTLRGDEWAVVKQIRIVANGTDVLRSFTGNDLWWINKFLYNTSPDVNTNLGDGSTANPSLTSHLKLPFWLPKSIRPMDTALDTRQLSDLTIEVEWGTFTDINASATAWTTEPKIEVFGTESFAQEGAFSTLRNFIIEKEITASNSQFQIDIPVNPVYRSFLLNFTDANVDDNAILNNFKMVSGSTVFADLPASVIRADSLIHSGVQRGFSGTAYDDLRIGNNNDLTGWYYYDHVTDGRLSEAIDTLGFSEFKLELDVTVGSGTTKARIIPFQIIPIRNAQVKG